MELQPGSSDLWEERRGATAEQGLAVLRSLLARVASLAARAIGVVVLKELLTRGRVE